jgi:dipeptidyl aminopeptidase/acylaminoacyl peptidase
MSQAGEIPLNWSRDGRFLLYEKIEGANPDLWALPLEGDRKPIVIANTPAIEVQGQFSPDGHWVVYMAFDSGNSEIYVRPFGADGPAAGTASKSLTSKWMVSNSGGTQPRWRRDGKEILYLSLTGKLMSVDVNASGNSFQAGVPKPLFDMPVLGGASLQTSTAYWDVTPDGQRFLVNAPSRTNENSSAQQITLVLNWASALKR